LCANVDVGAPRTEHEVGEPFGTSVVLLRQHVQRSFVSDLGRFGVVLGSSPEHEFREPFGTSVVLLLVRVDDVTE
jgi:hypothetical protein